MRLPSNVLAVLCKACRAIRDIWPLCRHITAHLFLHLLRFCRSHLAQLPVACCLLDVIVAGLVVRLQESQDGMCVTQIPDGVVSRAVFCWLWVCAICTASSSCCALHTKRNHPASPCQRSKASGAAVACLAHMLLIIAASSKTPPGPLCLLVAHQLVWLVLHLSRLLAEC